MRPTSRTAAGQFVWGTLPAPFLRRVFERIMVLRQERRMRVVMR